MRYKRAREAAKLTQPEAAQLLDVNQQTVSRWETGEIFPGEENARAAALYYHTTEPWLQYGVGDGVGEDPPHDAWQAFLDDPERDPLEPWQLAWLRARRFPPGSEVLPDTYHRLLFALKSVKVRTKSLT